jgi:hypothetical protein
LSNTTLVAATSSSNEVSGFCTAKRIKVTIPDQDLQVHSQESPLAAHRRPLDTADRHLFDDWRNSDNTFKYKIT